MVQTLEDETRLVGYVQLDETQAHEDGSDYKPKDDPGRQRLGFILEVLVEHGDQDRFSSSYPEEDGDVEVVRRYY